MTINLNSKWNPFGNAEDLPPAVYFPSYPFWARQLLWWIRNPLHNFTFHWIGVAGQVIKREDGIWNPNGGWRLSKLYTKHLWLPLLSYRGKYVEWYMGWRPNGGFGFPWPRKAKAKQPGE